MAGRSSLELLPPEVLAVVHEAIVEGATIDEIVRRIRAEGGRCSRSAVVRYAKPRRAMLRAWREKYALADFRLKSLAGQPEGESGRHALETVRSLAVRVADALDGKEEPPSVDQIAMLALALQRIESAGRSGAGGRGSAARGVTPLKGWPKSPEEQKKGLSVDAVNHIRAAVAGHWGIEGYDEGYGEPVRHAPETGRPGSP